MTLPLISPGTVFVPLGLFCHVTTHIWSRTIPMSNLWPTDGGVQLLSLPICLLQDLPACIVKSRNSVNTGKLYDVKMIWEASTIWMFYLVSFFHIALVLHTPHCSSDTENACVAVSFESVLLSWPLFSSALSGKLLHTFQDCTPASPLQRNLPSSDWSLRYLHFPMLVSP